jgi:hypothetical protein
MCSTEAGSGGVGSPLGVPGIVRHRDGGSGREKLCGRLTWVGGGKRWRLCAVASPKNASAEASSLAKLRASKLSEIDGWREKLDRCPAPGSCGGLRASASPHGVSGGLGIASAGSSRTAGKAGRALPHCCRWLTKEGGGEAVGPGVTSGPPRQQPIRSCVIRERGVGVGDWGEAPR